MKFIQKEMGTRFGEAYPVGNGQMGAAVYGSFPVERILLTENTFYSGCRSRREAPAGAKEAFLRMRELLKEGNYEEANREAENFHGERGDYGTSLPVGHLELCFCREAEGQLMKRSLDIRCGVAEAVVRAGEKEIRMETFASHPDHAVAWHMESSAPVDIEASFVPCRENGWMAPAPAGFLYMARAIETVHCNEPCGVTLFGRCEAVSDGDIFTEGGRLVIREARQVTLFLISRTDYLLLMEREPSPQEEKDFAALAWEELKQQGKELREKGYEEIKAQHEADVRGIMDEVELTIGGEGAGQEAGADTCGAAEAEADFCGAAQPGEAAGFFQYGRYLLLCSSREDSVLPAHLQGIWNDDVACRIGWSCDMHLDINTQMNYWPADMAGLSRTLEPLLRWTTRLAEEGKRSAAGFYGLPGWSAELVSNAWCWSAPYWAAPLSPYPTGGAWLLLGLWEHCLYTEDRELLREKVFPLMQGAAEFFAGYVFMDEKSGQLSCGPSISAENSFLYEGESYQISNGCTYELAVIRELFESYEKACGILETGVDTRLLERVKALMKLLPGYRILPDGTIAEWSHDLPAADPQHRHTSHLLGLFPFAQITPEETPELARAARKTIEKKLTPYENWEDTGWARSLLILYAARLHDGEKAWFHVKSMMENLREPNNMIYHPPTRGTVFEDDFGHVYELDGNTGLAAGIGEMLLQSHGGVIRLLPAIPREWARGHVKGLRARGNIQVEIFWEEGRVTEYILLSRRERSCKVSVNGETCEVLLKKDIPFRKKS